MNKTKQFLHTNNINTNSVISQDDKLREAKEYIDKIMNGKKLRKFYLLIRQM